MIKRLYLVFVLAFMAPFSQASALAEAERALAEGNIEAALDGYMTVLIEEPANAGALEAGAALAAQLGLVEVAADLWSQRVNLAVANGDRGKAAEINASITALYEQVPEWIDAKLAEAGHYSNDQADAVMAWEEMSLESQQALGNSDGDNAVAAQESALMVVQESFGQSHWLTAAALRDLGFVYRQLGLAEEAERYYGESLLVAEQILGGEHPNTLEINELIAELYGAMGLAEESGLLTELVINGYSTALGPAHAQTLGARYNALRGLEAAGQYADALGAADGLCQMIESNYGPYHPQSVNCLQTKAGIMNTMGELELAEETYRQVIERMGAAKPDVDAYVLNALLEIAEIYRVLGRYQQSKDLLSGVIHTALAVGDVERSYTAKSYLGRVLNNEGDYERARNLTEEVLDYGVQAWQATPVNVYNTLLELGSIYQAQGKLADAEATYEEALSGLVELLGENHPSALVASNNLGQIYELGGLYDQAEPLLKVTLEKMEVILGPDHPNTMNVRNNLALLHESQGNFREAEPLYKRSLDAMIALFGEQHNSAIAVKNNLAYLYMLMEEYEESAAMFAEVKLQWTTLFGEDHQNTLKATNNLGRIFKRQGMYAEAEQEISFALERRRSVLGENHLDVIRSMIDLGGVYIAQDRLDEAEAMLISALALAESQLGNLHPYTFEALNYLAQAKQDQGELGAAVELREKGFERRSDFLDTMLWSTGENAREGYVRLHRPEFNAYLSLLEEIGDEASARRLLAASLQRKGLLLKVTSEIQQIATMTTDPVLGTLASELEAARQRLASLTLSGPTAETQGKHTKMLYDLELKVNELQGQIGRASVRFRTSIAGASTERLEAEMKDNSAMVDFLAYESAGEPKLLAAVLTKMEGEIAYSLVAYEDREEVEDAVVAYRSIIQDDLADEDDLFEVGLETYELVWSPLMEVIEDLDYVYLIPDGVLNILPFNAMVNDEEEYLIQTHDLHQLTSGRDLLPNDYSLARGETVVLAGPDYDADGVVPEAQLAQAKGKRSAALKMGIRGAGTGLRGLNFDPLPGAEEEGRIIVDQVANKAAQSQNYFGLAAQEQILAGLKQPPEILHVATHGFFLEADETLRKRLLKAQRGTDTHIPPPGDNPLLRAGLAFAGINTNAQFLGDIDTTNDGVLTALEVLDLNLSGTRLVVLSACETGLGEIHEGEGVYGLRRSFQEAGVAEVVSSLWEVSDAGTQALMTDFYDRLLEGVPARVALRETQLDMLESPQWGYPYIWSAFMVVGSYESAGFAVN